MQGARSLPAGLARDGNIQEVRRPPAEPVESRHQPFVREALERRATPTRFHAPPMSCARRSRVDGGAANGGRPRTGYFVLLFRGYRPIRAGPRASESLCANMAATVDPVGDRPKTYGASHLFDAPRGQPAARSRREARPRLMRWWEEYTGAPERAAEEMNANPTPATRSRRLDDDPRRKIRWARMAKAGSYKPRRTCCNYAEGRHQEGFLSLWDTPRLRPRRCDPSGSRGLAPIWSVFTIRPAQRVSLQARAPRSSLCDQQHHVQAAGRRHGRPQLRHHPRRAPRKPCAMRPARNLST